MRVSGYASSTWSCRTPRSPGGPRTTRARTALPPRAPRAGPARRGSPRDARRSSGARKSCRSESVDAALARQRASDLDAADRVAAELEEVVVHARRRSTPSTSRQTRRGRAQRGGAAPRRGVVSARAAASAAGSALRSTLPFARQRQRVEHDERRRDHVLGQPRCRWRAERAAVGDGAPRRDVGDEPPVAPGVALARQHDRGLARRPDVADSAASISPSSMRKPRIFTWSSIAAEELELAVAGAGARDRRCGRGARRSGRTGSATNRSAVSSGRFR